MNELLQFCKDNKNVDAVIQYGSSARGDSSEDSDIDFFILLHKYKESDSIRIKEILRNKFTDQILDISIYESERFNLMIEHGSLFLWHLKIEGEKWYTSNYFDEQMLELAEFKGSIEDLITYNKIFNSTVRSIEKNGVNFFDLSILATLARNTLIIACYNFGNKEFGKLQVYQTCSQYYNEQLPMKFENYNELNNYRLYYSRNTPISELPSDIKVKEYILEVKSLIKFILNEINVYSSLDRLANIIYSKIDKPMYTSFELNIEIERDFYQFLRQLCKYYYQYDLVGLSKIHIDKFKEYLKKNSIEINAVIQQGIILYDIYIELKKDTNVYEPDRENLFELSKHIFESTVLIGRFTNYLINNKENKVISRLCKFRLFNKIIESIEHEYKIYNFSKDIQIFSRTANETINKIGLKNINK